MSTYYSGLNNQRDQNHAFQSSLPNNNDDLLNMQPVLGRLLDFTDGNSASMEGGEQNTQYQGLSLSLAMQEVPSSVHVSSYHDQYDENNKNIEYFSFDLAGAHNSVQSGAIDNLESSSISLREMNFTTHIYDSKYLKAVQDLLDEVANVQSATKQLERQNLYPFLQNGPEETDASDLQNSTDISSAERYDLESKMTALFSLLDKVDISYKQYYEQMQILVSSFEMVAGLGAARPYTSLALKTISRQFRCICDAIKQQIQAARQSLGNMEGERLYRLRHVDQQLRQQRLVEQFGAMRQPWRPLRGLPENAVSILRSWLFEHFLHPYPKETEKVLLARQTGLTRSQVANWFINARVRLWKPMIEEMYKEEVGDTEAGSFARTDSREANI